MRVNKHGEDKELRLCPHDKQGLWFHEINVHVWNPIHGISRKDNRWTKTESSVPLKGDLIIMDECFYNKKQMYSYKNKGK